jgi:hypothetical protein
MVFILNNNKNNPKYIKQLYMDIAVILSTSVSIYNIPELKESSDQLLTIASQLTNYVEKIVTDDNTKVLDIKSINPNLNKKEIKIVNDYKNLLLEKINKM